MRRKMGQLPIPIVIIIGILVGAGFLVLLDGVGFLFSLIPGIEKLPEYGVQLLGEAIAAIYAVGMMYLFGFQTVLKERGEGFLRGFYVGAFMFVMCVLVVIAQIYLQIMEQGGHIQSFGNILMFVITMFLIGLAEEGVFRGVLLNLFLNRFSKTKAGILWAVFVDGFLFGAMHLTNIFSGVSVKSAVVQAITAIILGMLLAAIYVRSGNFWICVILHAWIDFGSLMSGGIFGQGDIIDGINQLSYLNLISGVVYLIPCVILLRSSKLERLVMRANGMAVYETEQDAENAAVISLILGIFSIMTSCMGYMIGLGIIGIFAATISRQIKKEQNGMALAGLITSIVGVCFSVIGVVGLSLIYMFMDGNWMSMSLF